MISVPIRVGLIGLSARGGWAAAAHLPALRAVEGFDVRAVTASSPRSARAAAAEHDIPNAFDDAAALARSGEVDLAVVAVKVPHHPELVATVLDAGIPVLCEWPLAPTAETAEAMAAAASAVGVPALTTLQGRAAPAIQYLRDLVGDGYVGDVLSSTLVGSGVNWGGTVDSTRLYQLDRAQGATMLSIPFGHTLDAVTAVLGELTRITATTAVRRPLQHNVDTGTDEPMTAADQIAITGTFPSGAVLAAHFRGGISRGETFRWEINGTEGDLVVQVTPPLIQLGRISIRGARGNDRELTDLPIPPGYHLVPSLAGSDNWAVANLAHAYLQVREHLTSGAGTVARFDDAVRLHRLLTKIEKAGNLPLL